MVSGLILPKALQILPGDGSGYDATRIAILKRMANEIWSIKEDAYVILEHLAGIAGRVSTFPSWNVACGAIKMLILPKPPWGIMIRENRISAGSLTWKGTDDPSGPGGIHGEP
jgi:hypothetical protein